MNNPTSVVPAPDQGPSSTAIEDRGQAPAGIQDKTIFGFWVYLMTDLIVFAALFAVYAVLRGNTFGGPSARELFSLPTALTETLILLTSSFTCGLAMIAVHRGTQSESPLSASTAVFPAARPSSFLGVDKAIPSSGFGPLARKSRDVATKRAFGLGSAKNQAIFWFGVTFALGLAFLALELTEFSRLVADGNSWQRSAFLSSFFTLVGTHGLHIAVGLLWMLVSMVQIWFRPVRHSLPGLHSSSDGGGDGGGLTPFVTSKLIRLSLFWHFLDIVWIFIFTIVYLMGTIR